MKTIEYILLITLISFLTNCKRACQDERADNYDEGPRKYSCDYSYADNWYKEIILDSLVINGVQVQLEDVTAEYDRSILEDNYYHPGGSNRYTAYIDSSIYLKDSIESISYTFSLPVANDFDVIDVEGENGSLVYKENGNRESLFFREEGFNFLEEKELNGIKYYVFNVSNNVGDISLINTNFKFSTFQLALDFNEYSVNYEITIFKL